MEQKKTIWFDITNVPHVNFLLPIIRKYEGEFEMVFTVRDFKAKFGGELVEHGRFLCVRKPLLYWIGKTGVKLLKRG